MSRRARGRARLIVAGAAVVALLPIAACTSSDNTNKEPGPVTKTSTAIDSADVLCGFVPRGPVEAALDGASVTTRGQVLGAGDDRTGACGIYAPDNRFPAMEVYLGPAVNNSVGPDAAMIVHDVAANPDWTRFPASDGIGWAHPQYEATVDGHKTTGALTYLAWGDWVVGVRLYRPRPGRDAVKDAMAIASAVPPALGLAKQPSTPYPSYTAN